MVKPRFVKSIVKDGQVVEDIAPEILNPAIASPKAISEIQTILEKSSAKDWERKQDPSNSMYPGNRYCTGFTRKSRVHEWHTPLFGKFLWIFSFRSA